MPQCALCLNDVPKLCRSHIIPEFFYKKIYDDKNRFQVFSHRQNGPILPPQQKGLRQRLLCSDCENVLSGWERYSKHVLFGGVELGFRDAGDHMEYVGLDYAKYKLFQLSMLWRMGVASGPGFDNVQLGPRHSERLRSMLLAQDPGEPYEYGCWMAAISSEMNPLSQVILAPTSTPRKVLGHSCYRSVLGGMFWCYFVSSHMRQFNQPQMFLSKEGHLRVWKEGSIARRFIEEFIGGVSSANDEYLSRTVRM
jgi:hypothetical protein